jgi:hypothetical protein
MDYILEIILVQSDSHNAEASRQELPVRTCQGKPEMSVGMLTKLWADWVFRMELKSQLWESNTDPRKTETCLQWEVKPLD